MATSKPPRQVPDALEADEDGSDGTETALKLDAPTEIPQQGCKLSLDQVMVDALAQLRSLTKILAYYE